MADFQLLQNQISKKWVILAPRRAKRPNVSKATVKICPFCLGKEKEEIELYRIGGQKGDTNWQVLVFPNKFSFTPIHELIIHSPDHHKNFDELPLDQVKNIFRVYLERFRTHERDGQVYIFHNRGEEGGESLPHPHTQLTVIPFDVSHDIPPFSRGDEDLHESNRFVIFCPQTSAWPDEVWVAPKTNNRKFSEITDEELSECAYIFQRLILLLNLRHGNDFPFNFYIYPGNNWYLRIIPRQKSLGGFEVGTGIFVNTQDPKETIGFIKEHFENPDLDKIKTDHRALYLRSV